MLLTLSDLPKVNKWAQAVPFSYALHSQITAGLFIKPGPSRWELRLVSQNRFC